MSSTIDKWAEDFYGKPALELALNTPKARRWLRKKRPPIEDRIIRDKPCK